MIKTDIEMLINKQMKISDRNYQYFQETGEQRYQREYRKAEDIIDVCRMALSIADTKAEYMSVKSNLASCAAKAIQLQHEGRWADGEHLADVGSLIMELAAYGRMIGVRDPWEERHVDG